MTRDSRLPAETSEDELLELVAQLNGDDAIDGILVQLPLPDHIDEARVIRAVEPIKDVDGFHPFNAGHLYLGNPTHVPATPLGVMTLLDEYDVELQGANAVVVGRSDIVGKPMAMMLLHAHATVTICHSRTRDLGEHTRQADVLVVAVGRRGVVGSGDVKEGAAVIDVGMNRTDEGLRGDVDPAAAEVAGPDHAGAGRRRPDDDRNPAQEHGSRRSLPPWASCVPRGVTVCFGRFNAESTVLPGPSFCCCRRRNVG